MAKLNETLVPQPLLQKIVPMLLITVVGYCSHRTDYNADTAGLFRVVLNMMVDVKIIFYF
jgi:hypothetical protein